MKHSWTVHPLRRVPARGLAASGVIVSFCVLVGWAFSSVAWAAFSAAVLLLSTTAFWFPTRYVIDEEGVAFCRLGGERRRPWSDLRRLELFGGPDGGALLSPLPRASALDRVRGVELRWNNNRDAVIDAIRARMDAARTAR